MNNIAVDENIIFRTDSEEDLNNSILQITKDQAIDAIFALEETDTVAALKFGLKNGFKIPEELSIIGFADGILASRRLTPSVTTVSQHAPEIGERAAQLLIDRLETKEENLPFKTIVIKTILKERESTRQL